MFFSLWAFLHLNAAKFSQDHTGVKWHIKCPLNYGPKLLSALPVGQAWKDNALSEILMGSG